MVNLTGLAHPATLANAVRAPEDQAPFLGPSRRLSIAFITLAPRSGSFLDANPPPFPLAGGEFPDRSLDILHAIGDDESSATST